MEAFRDLNGYDTLIEGGDFAMQQQRISSRRHIRDCDGFVIITSKGPEEIIPGQVLDTVDILYKDPTRYSGSFNYIGDGSTKLLQ